MRELQLMLDQVKELILGVWLKRRYILLFSWLICPVGWIVVAKMPDIYTSNARIHVDTQSLLRPLLQGLTVQTNPNEQISLMVKTLMSRPNLEKIIRMSDLDISVTSRPEYEQLLIKLNKQLQLKSAGKNNLYTIAYSHPDAAKAKEVVQAAIDVFIENTLGEKREQSDSAGRFLDEQILDYEKRLSAAEQRLAEFKREYAGVLPGSGNNYYQEMEEAKANLDSVNLKLRETRTQLQNAKAQILSAPSSDSKIVESRLAEVRARFEARITTQRQALDELKLRFTENHPDVMELQRRISSLEIERDKELERVETESRQELTRPGMLDDNPVYQELQISVNRLENEVASLEVRANNYRRKVYTLESKVDQVPKVEAELTALNRDYSITKSRYETLLQRRESAKLSQKAEASSDDIQFKVIEPPLIPVTPSGPNRLLYLFAVTILGFGAGIGVSFLLGQLANPVLSAEQLARITQTPILGTLPRLQSRKEVVKQRIKAFIFFCGIALLLAIFVVLAIIEVKMGRIPLPF